ncbi:MAG: hypothetical protein IK094_03925 [Treponema sp.]|nr:hypothetical protein [Treponema sp.]
MKKIWMVGVLLVFGIAAIFAEAKVITKTKSKEGYDICVTEDLFDDNDINSIIYMTVVANYTGKECYVIVDEDKGRVMHDIEIYEQKGFESVKADIQRFSYTSGSSGNGTSLYIMNLTNYPTDELLN